MKSTSPFTFRWLFPKHCIYVTDLLKLCMCKFDAENSLVDKWQVFNSHVMATAPSQWWLIVHTLWNLLLIQLSLDRFKTLHIQTKWKCDCGSLMLKKNTLWQNDRFFNCFWFPFVILEETFWFLLLILIITFCYLKRLIFLVNFDDKAGIIRNESLF